MSSDRLLSQIQQLIRVIESDYGRCKPFTLPSDIGDEFLQSSLKELNSRITSTVNPVATFRTSAYLAAVLARELLLIKDSFEWSSLDTIISSVCAYFSENRILANSADDLVRVAQTAANGDLEVALKTVSALRTLGKFGVTTYSFHIADQDTRICERFEEAGHFALGVDPINSTENPLIVVCIRHLTSTEWQTILDLAQQASCPILCFTSVEQPDANERINVVVLPQSMPAYESNLWLGDIAVWCGAIVVSEPVSLHAGMIGEAGRVETVNDEVLIYEPQHSEKDVYERIENYTQRIDGHEVINSKVKIQQHLSAIGAPYVELQLYAPNEQGLMDLQHITFSAMSAARSAIEAGFAPGGGVRFLQAVGDLAGLEGDVLGQAVKNVLRSPFQAMFDGDDSETESAIQYAQSHPDASFDAVRQRFVSASRGGPLDPTQFGIESLQEAVDTVKQLLTTTC